MDLWRGPIFTISNGFSVLRVFLLPFFFWTVSSYAEKPETLEYLIYSMILTALAVLTDFLDGWTARKWNQASHLGRYVDPVCDKIVTIGGLFLIQRYFGFPLWILLVYVVREVAGIWFGLFLYLKRGIQGKPNLWGKIGVGWVAFSVLWYMLVPYFKANGYEGEFLYRPDLSAYLLFFILLGGVVQYAVSYWQILLTPETVVIDPENKRQAKTFRQI